MINWFNIVSTTDKALVSDLVGQKIKRARTCHRWTRNCVGRSKPRFVKKKKAKIFSSVWKKKLLFRSSTWVFCGWHFSTQDISLMLKKSESRTMFGQFHLTWRTYVLCDIPWLRGQSLFAWQEGKKQCCHPSLDLQYGARAEGGGASAREAVDGLSTTVGGEPVGRWGATLQHYFIKPPETL